MRLSLRVAVLASLVIGFTACTKKKPASTATGDSTAIFSSRPIEDVPDVYIITLKSPPILRVATKTIAGWNIPDEARRAVLEEQQQFELKLKSLAPQAQIIYRYRLTLNALAVYTTEESANLLQNIPGVKAVVGARKMGRPQFEASLAAPALSKVNSANFIGAEEAYKRGFTGLGRRVGVIDTGVDYTHRMLGGPGTEADFKNVNPNLPSALFPNAKVTGGVDLVGSEFDTSSPYFAKRFPLRDPNPIDEAGHGSHVAGTIAGIGDGVTSFDGVAKDAEIVAIKVFGKDGSTMDAVVIAGFEYAVDPNGDLIPDDQLDVVNLSLGGEYGQPQILYSEAIANVVAAGTVVVASAGNAGPLDYVVGAPSTAIEALSVAASIDGSDHNWKFPTVQFVTASNPELFARFEEGEITKPLAEIEALEGELVDIGLADKDLTDEQKAALVGKVALISRGGVPFIEKLTRAEAAGAIGAVVYNNAPGKPIGMGGEGKLNIPGVMVSQDVGLKILEEMKTAPVLVRFKTSHLSEEPELIDTITDFSSKGPRSEDYLLKPEISAPGQSIISAGFGTGNKAVEMSGTSMAAPNMSGAIALLRQARPSLTAKEIKALAMNTARILTPANLTIPISLQGAGRVQIDQALNSPVLVEPAGLSLGQVAIENSLTQNYTLHVKNFSASDVTLAVSSESDAGLTLAVPASVTIPAGGSADVAVEATFSVPQNSVAAAELDGRIFFKNGEQLVVQVPAIAIRTLASSVSTPQTTAGAMVQLNNSSPREGQAFAFNLLGEDATKSAAGPRGETWMSRSCDLQSVGYRIVKKPVEGADVDFVQFGFKLFTPLTTWQYCEPVVLIDSNEDGVADQELAGVSKRGIEGLESFEFASVLIDAATARGMRLNYEEAIAHGRESKLDYTKAALNIGAMTLFDHSTLAIIEVPATKLEWTATGKLNVKAAALYQGGDAIEGDDYLGADEGTWSLLEGAPEAQPYFGMPEVTAVPPGGAPLVLQKGAGVGKLILYYPSNGLSDPQFQIIE